MVIQFSNEKARSHLLKNGFVYTLRNHKIKAGRNWANSGRGTKKIADVLIEEHDGDMTDEHVKGSGFSSASEWFENYLDLADDFCMMKARLYKVTVLKGDGA